MIYIKQPKEIDWHIELDEQYSFRHTLCGFVLHETECETTTKEPDPVCIKCKARNEANL